MPFARFQVRIRQAARGATLWGAALAGCTPVPHAPTPRAPRPELVAALAAHERPLTLAEVDRRAAPAPAFDSLYPDPHEPAYPYSDAALVQAVRARRGRVSIRVKALGDPPMLASGRRVRPVIPAGTPRVPGAVDTAYAYQLSAASAADVRAAARWLVECEGVPLHHYFPSMATFGAVVRPEDAPALRRSRHVSCLEPGPVLTIPAAAGPVRTAPVGPP